MLTELECIYIVFECHASVNLVSHGRGVDCTGFDTVHRDHRAARFPSLIFSA